MSSTRRVAIYARISEDGTGEGAGVARQLEACRALATERGDVIVAELSDNDISALTGKHRPGYARVLEHVERGEVDAVLVWQTSRLLRNRRERAAAIELFAKHRVSINAVKGTSLDLSTAQGRGLAGLLGEFDTMESEVKAERVAAAAADRARRGVPSGSLGYGWTKTGTGAAAVYEVDPEEAEIVREVTRRLLAGESLLGVTADLNRRGVAAPSSAAWGKTSVKKLALRPSNAALRVHHRGRPDEVMYDGSWPPLVGRREWEKVCALLADPIRQTNGTARPGARKHLLSWGIGECGVCGGRLRVALKGNQKWGTKYHLYVCDDKGCVGRRETSVDALVRGVVLARLQLPDALDWLLGDDEAARQAGARLDELQARLDKATDEFADGKIDARQLERITSRLRPQITAAAENRRRLAASLDLDTLQSLAGPHAEQRWDAMTIPERRAVLTALGMTVVVKPVTRRGPGFDPDSVDVRWSHS